MVFADERAYLLAEPWTAWVEEESISCDNRVVVRTTIIKFSLPALLDKMGAKRFTLDNAAMVEEPTQWRREEEHVAEVVTERCIQEQPGFDGKMGDQVVSSSKTRRPSLSTETIKPMQEAIKRHSLIEA